MTLNIQDAESNASGKLVLVRHGQSLWNLENRFTGWVDIAMTEQGMLESRTAGLHLQHLRFHLALTSNLQRAHHTLQLLLEAMNHHEIPIERHEALNERHYGELQGLNKAEVAQQFGDEQVRLWRRSFHVQPPGGESLKDTVDRVRPYLAQRILPAIPNQNILVVAHGNSLRAITMILENLSPEEVIELNIANCQPIIYDLTHLGEIISKKIVDGS